MPRCRSIGMSALVLVAVLALPGCAARLAFSDPPPIDPQNRQRCDVRSKSDLRACLVPAGSEHDATKQVGPNCYWRKFDSETVKFHVKANGKNRRFSFEVVNLCAEPLDVQMEFAAVKDFPLLEFVTAGCAMDAPVAPWSVRSRGNAVTACDSQRYRGGGKAIYKREVKFYVTYNMTRVYFDPEIAVKDAEAP